MTSRILPLTYDPQKGVSGFETMQNQWREDLKNTLIMVFMLSRFQADFHFRERYRLAPKSRRQSNFLFYKTTICSRDCDFKTSRI